MNERTQKQTLAPTPVKAIRIRVVEGPNRGAELVAGQERITIGTASGSDLVLQDPMVSRLHLGLRRVGTEIILSDLGSTNGTRIGAVLLRSMEVSIAVGAVVEIGETRLVVEDAEKYVLRGTGPDAFGALLGRSTALRSVTSELARVAPTEVGVLILGESGTGKELAARAVHGASPRAQKPFVTVDCASVHPTLFASELFGHERGAFTGADRQHVGAFQRADGGTLFLDEIGELTIELQAALLGALERRRIRTVGGTEEVPVDIRIVAATHRPLAALVNEGSFRLDLYYRLAAITVTMPPLRERPDDIPRLVHQFLEEANKAAELETLFDAEVMQRLQKHSWPGNVRELRNVVQNAIAFGQAPELNAVLPVAENDSISSVLELDYNEAKRRVLDEFQRRWLTRLVERTQGNVRAASREGGIERKHLIELLRRHGIK